ncbi:MAG: glycosyltransferase [Marinilabiliaceae bacterium]|nr:glycosyltransferase [Marinilabiliaceae bacterium]
MRIVFIASYPPRQCGIGTFTYNLRTAMAHQLAQHDNCSTSIVAISPESGNYIYPTEVQKVVPHGDYKAYEEAADYINDNFDLCILQHEFGIFGGVDGIFILSLIYKLKLPLITTFHTVLNQPSEGQRLVMEAISKKSSGIVVMNQLAVDFLEHIYKVPREKIKRIEHGVPAFSKPDRGELRHDLGFNSHKVLLTFGLLSRNKGLETVIKALPRVVKHFPELKYIILGKTHPNVVKQSGEEYRNYLKLLANKRGVSANVVFDDRFVSDQELLQMIYASDVYLTPYQNEEQISSGTLAYAVGVGALVVSTPFWHARELLDEQRGVFFPFESSDILADKMINLLQNPREMAMIRDNAALYGAQLSWPKIAHKYIQLSQDAVDNPVHHEMTINHIIDLSVLPDYNMQHLLQMTDSTGLLQHARYDVPDFNEGYCLDDNARGLLLVAMAYRYVKDEHLIGLIQTYLGFINYMRKPDGGFHNHLNYDRTYNPTKDSEDSIGRLIWGLGCFYRYVSHSRFSELVAELLDEALKEVTNFTSIRGKANAIIGLSHLVLVKPEDQSRVDLLNKLSRELMSLVPKEAQEKWVWFEEELTYDNGLMPLALLHAYQATGNELYLKTARRTLRFLESHVFEEGNYNPIGNQKWYRKGDEKSLFDQQSVEPMTMTSAYLLMYKITNEPRYLEKLYAVYLWYLGENALHRPMYDHETGGCYDGLSDKGVNANKGAESTLAYWISHFTVMEAYYQEHEWLILQA